MAMFKVSETAVMRGALLVMIQSAHHAACLHLSGSLPMSASVEHYAGKFCFDYDPEGKVDGTLALSVFGDLADANLYFLLFDDEPQHWQQAHSGRGSLPCEDLVRLASEAIPLSPLDGSVKEVRIHEKIRPRFWYFSFVTCGRTRMEPIVYDIHLLNPRQGYQQEFGLDQEGSLQLQSAAAALFLCLALAMWYVAHRSGSISALRSRPISRLLLVSAACSAIGAACRAIQLAVFAFDGHGSGVLEVLGQICVGIAKSALALQLLFAAKGWALFYGRAELVQRCATLCTLGALLVVSAACEIHAEWALDWSPSLNLYESWSGTLVLVLNALLCLEVARSLRITYQEVRSFYAITFCTEPSQEVRSFYAFFAMVSGSASVYFMSAPVLCMLASSLAPSVRFKYVDRIEFLSRFAATLLLALSLRPSQLAALTTERLEEHLQRRLHVFSKEEAKLCEGADSDEGA